MDFINKKEDKELIRKDVCARLMTGIFLYNLNLEESGGLHVKMLDEKLWRIYSSCEVLESIPILRPLESMTDDEKKEYDMIRFCHSEPVSSYCAKIVDFYIAHYFDFRGLIKKGLAKADTKGIYRLYLSKTGQ